MAITLTFVLVITATLIITGSQASNSKAERRQFQNTGQNRWPRPQTEWSVTEYNGGRARRGDLIFEEEFHNFNFNTWKHEVTMAGGGNWEFQMYHNNRSNSYTKYGKLYIKPTLTADTYGEDFLTRGEIDLSSGPPDGCTEPKWFGCKRQGTPTNIINPVMSARISTINSFAFKYGTVKIKAKLPAGDWLWPAIWLLPKNNQYGGWPASGEIDIMESRGNLKLVNSQGLNVGAEQFASTLHFGPFSSQNRWDKAHFEKNSGINQGYDQDFHVYGLEWTPEHIRFTIDDQIIGTVSPTDRGGFWALGQFSEQLDNPWKYSENMKMAPFDQEFYIIINLAAGGTNGYFSDSVPNSRKPWRNDSPRALTDFWNKRADWHRTWIGEEAAFQVEYVKVWAL